MNRPVNTPHHNHILLKDIDSYGHHISTWTGIVGRICSLAHWSTKYDETNLRMRYVEWAQQPGFLNLDECKSCEFDNFFAGLNSLKTANSAAFTNANSRHIAQILDAFNQNEAKLQSVFAFYKQLSANSPDFNIDAFIAATNKVLAERGQNQVSLDDIEKTIAADQREASRLYPRLSNSMYDGHIWETSCTVACYIYEDLPVINACLNALTGSMLFSGFWGFFFAGAFAELSVSVISPGLKGLYQKGSAIGACDAIIENWNQRVADDNTFHPLVEIAIGCAYIAVSWLYIDQLQKAAKLGDHLHTMMEWGIKGFILKYSTMHAFFTLKAELHKGTNYAKVFHAGLDAFLMGAIRGLIKNPLAAFSSKLQAAFNLDTALNLSKLLQRHPQLQVHTQAICLSQWMASIPSIYMEYIPKFLTSPQLLYTTLWLAKDAWEVAITNLSSFIAQLALELRKPILASIIVAIIAYNDPQIIHNYFNSTNVSVA